MKQYSFHLIIGLLLTVSVQAQDPLFSQFYYAPLYMNPALTGCMRNDFRISGVNRMQWTRLPQPLMYTNVSVDKHLYYPQASMGLMVNHFSEGYLRTTGVYLSLAKNIGSRTEECHDLFISMGMQIGWVWKGLNTSKLLFGDQLSETQGILGIPSDAEIFRQPNQNYLDAGAGLLATWGNFCAGSALHHITRPHDGLGGSSRSSRLPMRLTANLSYNNERENVQPIVVKPSVVLNLQGKSSSLAVGALIDFKEYFSELSIWYRNNADFGGNSSHSISAGINFRFLDKKAAYNNGVDKRYRLGSSVDMYLYNPTSRHTGLSFEGGGFYDSRSANYEGECPSDVCPNKFPWMFF